MNSFSRSGLEGMVKGTFMRERTAAGDKRGWGRRGRGEKHGEAMLGGANDPSEHDMSCCNHHQQFNSAL